MQKYVGKKWKQLTKDEQKELLKNSLIVKQYGYITMLRLTVIRYHLVNDYERTRHDNKTIIQGSGVQMRQTDAKVKRKLLDTEPQAVEV